METTEQRDNRLRDASRARLCTERRVEICSTAHNNIAVVRSISDGDIWYGWCTVTTLALW